MAEKLIDYDGKDAMQQYHRKSQSNIVTKSILATLIVWWNFKIGSLYKSWDIEKNDRTEAFQMFATIRKSKEVILLPWYNHEFNGNWQKLWW